MKRAHLILGIAALFAFILSGQYMDKVYNHLRGMADTPRMLFRSRHIYILFCSALNLALGTYLKGQPPDWRQRIQWLGSAMIFAGTALFMIAFMYEPARASLSYLPFSQNGAYLIAAGTLAHVIAGAA